MEDNGQKPITKKHTDVIGTLAKRMEKPLIRLLSEKIIEEAINRSGENPSREQVKRNAESVALEVLEAFSKNRNANIKQADVGIEQITPENSGFSLKNAIEEAERRLIKAALEKTNGEMKRAAGLLEISVRALKHRIKAYQISGHFYVNQTRPIKQEKDKTYSIKDATRRIEEKFIRAALKKCNYDVADAAKTLGITHRALIYKIRNCGIEFEPSA